jgi:hypothetical protein
VRPESPLPADAVDDVVGKALLSALPAYAALSPAHLGSHLAE